VFLIGAVIVAIRDAARSVAFSRLVWTDFDHFLSENTFFDLTQAKFYVLLKLGADFFAMIDRFVLQAPVVVIFGFLATLCMLLSAQRPKN